MKKLKLIVLLLILAATVAIAQKSEPILERNVRAHMDFLAGDPLQGRGSGTESNGSRRRISVR
ncbi:MAG: hypothetical protein IPK58_06805 [Acidobacteria bacterium]|nr:hypothetical protein [Acidobacteriota bacterium]